MRIQGRTLLALAAAAVVGACAPAGDGATGPQPGETRYTTAAKLALAQADGASGERQQELYEEALQQSLEGIESAPGNPQHHYLAGLAYAGLDDFEAADSMWVHALEIFPGYESEVAIAREQAWAQAFNQGVNAYNAGDMEAAVREWQRANDIYDRRPEGYFNLAAIYSAQERYDDAISAFEEAIRALERDPGRELTEEEEAERTESHVSALQNLGNLQLFTEQFGAAERTFQALTELQPDDVQAQSSLAVARARQGRQDEAMAVYEDLLARPDLEADQIMSVGIGLFQAEEYGQAASAFRRITESQPQNRDAWYNLLNALYAEQRWDDAIPVAERLIELDPLNENAHLIAIQALRETRQQDRALTYAERNIEAPIHVDNILLRMDNGQTVLAAVAMGNSAPEGTPVQLEFTFYGPDGRSIGTERATVAAPAQNASRAFEVTLPTETVPAGFRYSIVP